MKIINLSKLTLIVLLLSISACKTNDLKESSVTVFDMNNNQLSVIDDEKQLTLFNESWKNKNKVVFKKRPDFDVKLSVKINDATTEWLYGKSGVVTSVDANDSVFYKVNLELINGLIEKL